jgi:hypothetical protein
MQINASFFPLNGYHSHYSVSNQCATLPTDCCCSSGNFQLKTDEMNSNFISFENLISAYEKTANTKYSFVKLISFSVEDSSGVAAATLTQAQLDNTSLITDLAPLAIGTAFNIEEFKVFHEVGKSRGIRFRHNVPANSPLSAQYKMKYKVRFKSDCDQGLIIEISDCAMAKIVKCYG